MLVYTCFHVFSPFSAHFYPPLHHNGKGSIADRIMADTTQMALQGIHTVQNYGRVNMIIN